MSEPAVTAIRSAVHKHTVADAQSVQDGVNL